MHYGDKLQIRDSKLILIIYNHEILGCKLENRIKVDNTWSKRYVDYAVTSIQYCEFFNPRTLMKILKDPYKFVNNEFSKRELDPKNEGWFEVHFTTTDGYNAKITKIWNVDKSMNHFKHLH